MNNSFQIRIQDNAETMFIGISGAAEEDDLEQFETTLFEVENSKGHKIFVFDFSYLDKIPPIAMSVIVLMQMEARKKAQVYTIAPTNHLRILLLSSGAIRDTELLLTYRAPSQPTEREKSILKWII